MKQLFIGTDSMWHRHIPQASHYVALGVTNAFLEAGKQFFFIRTTPVLQ